MRIGAFAISCIVILSSFGTFLHGMDPFVKYDIDEMNDVWDDYESHRYSTRTSPSQHSVEIADRIITHDEIYLLRYWEPTVIPKSQIDWSEDPFEDWTWQFYYHSLRMVSYLVSAHQYTNDLQYLIEAKWYISSWIEHNPDPRMQASERAWDDHSTANRILTFLQFWDSYRNSEIFDENFSMKFFNILRLHGEFTADPDNYYWGHNHGIYQDRALIQLSTLFPNFKESNGWNNIAKQRLQMHIVEDFSELGVHKEHSPAYHQLALTLFVSIKQFNDHYDIENQDLDNLIISMQEYSAYIVKPNGNLPLVGDSGLESGLRIEESLIVNDLLMYVKTNGEKGTGSDLFCKLFKDGGVGILKKYENSTQPNFYFGFFNAFHSSVHKQNDDLSFVLSLENTDYFVDSGKYNFQESDKFRKYVRSVFAHNTIAIDNLSYDNKNSENFHKSVIYDHKCESAVTIFQGMHDIYQGTRVHRNIIILNDNSVVIHDIIKSQQEREVSQIFNIGKDVNIDYLEQNNLSLSSNIDDTSLRLVQHFPFEQLYHSNGSLDPIRGWQSETFNQISPINNLVYTKSGKDVEFLSTIVNSSSLISLDVKYQGDEKIVYTVNGIEYELFLE